jgi:7-carboxy-7-deazaguanine synthase
MGPVRLVVNEIFHSIQGESTHAGRPCVFVRLTGCNLRCVWCDTAYAFHEGSPMTVDAVLERVRGHDCRLVEITGGEPLLQPAALQLMERLLAEGYEVLLETGGSLSIAEVPEGVRRIVDVKCPDSGEADRNLWENLAHLRDGDELKFVLASRDDYVWARDQVKDRELAGRAPILFSPVHGSLDAAEMARWILEDGLPVRMQLQLHKLLWPAATRGV